jgi:hypothetical protein
VIEEDQDESQLRSSALLEQASKFLEDPTIRDAPWDKKVVFLRSKGVKDEEIEKLRKPQPERSITDMESEGERAWPKVRTLKSARRFGTIGMLALLTLSRLHHKPHHSPPSCRNLEKCLPLSPTLSSSYNHRSRHLS